MMDAERLAILKQGLEYLEADNPPPRSGYAAREIRKLRREIASIEALEPQPRLPLLPSKHRTIIPRKSK